MLQVFAQHLLQKGEIKTTLPRAKALKSYTEKLGYRVRILRLGKRRGDNAQLAKIVLIKESKKDVAKDISTKRN